MICAYILWNKNNTILIICTFIVSDDDNCPVRTYCKYKSKLNKNCPFFFQRPSKNPKEDCWFDSVPIGHNMLGSMMSTISKESGLSRIYINHSLRAKTVHVLDVARFLDRHIMSVTGHKAQSSLKTYTGYTDSKTKQNMSNTLSNALWSTTSEIKRTSTYSNAQETVVKV